MSPETICLAANALSAIAAIARAFQAWIQIKDRIGRRRRSRRPPARP